jgi:hypothetical protein
VKNEIIKINDWTLTKIDESAEPMIADLDLATRLGYKRPTDIRKIIKRMVEAGQLGERCATVAYHQEVGGQEVTAYYLTESQSLKVIARSKTDAADKILDEVIAVYLAYRRGQLTPAPDAEAIAKLIRETIREEVRLALSPAPVPAPKTYPTLHLQEAPVRVLIKADDFDALLREFLERFYLESPQTNTLIHDMLNLFNNGWRWQWPRVHLEPFMKSLQRLLPGRVTVTGKYLVIGIVVKEVFNG